MKRLFKSFSDAGAWISMLCCVLAVTYLETALHLLNYGSLQSGYPYVVLFSFAAGFAVYFICTVVPRRAANTVFMILLSLLVLYFEIQVVYRGIFGEFMSLWQFSAGAEAVTNFRRQMISGIVDSIVPILIIAVPIPVFAVLTHKRVVTFDRRSISFPVTSVILLFAFLFGTVGIMKGTDTFAYETYNDPYLQTETGVRNFGLLTTARLELTALLQGESELPTYVETGDPVDIPEREQHRYNMLDIDFDTLAAETDNESYKFLDEYFHSKAPTRKNEYTGLCEGYNLIYLCAESFSPVLIDPERTPTLYRLSNDGFVFKNYFGCFASNTTNGEYAGAMGLYPDMSRKKSLASFYASSQNYLPFCYGKLFSDIGAEAFAYHNYLGSFYNREESHPNMGYTFKSVGNGLDMEVKWPASDLEMMQKSVDDYINSGKQFVAYYMTFSGHYEYDWHNPMSAKNRERVKDLPYSETAKAYVACNYELEDALTYLTERLEEAGIADRTVIVLTNDHYPYGLSDSEFDELAGEHVDQEIEKYRNSFICYVPGVHEEIETYCCSVDILPTVLNLFGLPYDSRLLSGKDVLSEDAANYAVLYNKSIVTPDFSYSAETGKLRRRSEELIDEDKVLALRDSVSATFNAASLIVNSDYYRHAMLGEKVGGTFFEKYNFNDMPESVEFGAIKYVCDNGYIVPKREDYFGFDLPLKTQEFIRALYMMAGSPDVSSLSPEGFDVQILVGDEYLPSAMWALKNGIVEKPAEAFNGNVVIDRLTASMIMENYAEYRGADMPEIDDKFLLGMWKGHVREFTEDEVHAVLFAFYGQLLRGDGTPDSALDMSRRVLSRMDSAELLYHYELYFNKK
ncbi:MAG: LTA synthase family protein [Clostridia bacterium]|nr:LTA synthase family protein [Clostridia bacterium]